MILRSSFKIFVASRTSLNTGLSVMDFSYAAQAACRDAKPHTSMSR